MAKRRRGASRPPKKPGADLQRADVVEMLGLEAIIVPHDVPDPRPLRALLRKKIARKPGVVVGDVVTWAPVQDVEDDGPDAVINGVVDRTNVLTRAGFHGRPQPISSNLDKDVIVVSPAEPPLRLGLIDRYLVAVFAAKIEPVICLNKADLDEDGEALEALSVYSGVARVVTTVATETRSEVEDLRALLTGQRSVLVGHSGVGKSSIAKGLIPGLQRAIGAVSDYHGRGRHTTTTASLLELPGGGALVDTPGIRSFGIYGIEPIQLRLFYPDFLPLAEMCRFRTCTHAHEPACAVMAAVDDETLDYDRYERYLELMISLENQDL